MLKLIFFLILSSIISHIFSVKSFGQDHKDKLLKIGIFGYPFYKKDVDPFSLHFEYEKKNTFIKSISTGLGIDYVRFNKGYSINYGGTSKSFNDRTVLYNLRYNLTFYPMYYVFKHKSYTGLLLGIAPCIYYEDPRYSEDRYGIGLWGFSGIQILIKNKFSFSYEIDMTITTDFNDDRVITHEHNYLMWSTNMIKFGIHIN